MPILLVVLVYLAATGLPVALLYFFREQAWYWHALSLAAALCLGLVPMPPGWQSAGMTMLVAFTFTFLMIWGIGGLALSRLHHRHEKHA